MLGKCWLNFFNKLETKMKDASRAKTRWNSLLSFVSMLVCTSILALVAGCGGGGGGNDSTANATVPSGSTWVGTKDVNGTVGKYTPLVITGSDAIRVYGNGKNIDGSDAGSLYLRQGSFSGGVGGASAVIAPYQLSDMPGGIGFIRTSAVVKGATKYYAIVHVGNNYENNTSGYQPAWATSDDGVNWSYHGRIKIDGGLLLVFSSGAALIVQEEKPAVLDTVNPANNRYLVWDDGYGPKLVLIYSADGIDWHFYRDTNHAVVDVWPNDPAIATDNPVFSTASRTPFGYHIIAADTYPSKHHRHLWSCNGLSFRVLEQNAPTYLNHDNNAKGTNLVFDPSTGLLHAITLVHEQSTGSAHWTLQAQAFPC